MAIIIIRTIIIYLALLVTMRVLGKRQLGELELSEFVVAALIADLASHPLQAFSSASRAFSSCAERSIRQRCAKAASHPKS